MLILENSSCLIAPLAAATNNGRIFNFNNVVSQSGKRLGCDCCRILENEPAKGKNVTFTCLRKTVLLILFQLKCVKITGQY